MKKKPENFTWALAIFLILLIASSIICMAHSECFSANQASILGGVFGAIATGLLGGIAFWQNKRYKELSDELNDRAYMPELYKMDNIFEELQITAKNSHSTLWFGATGGNALKDIDCGAFMVLRPPILEIEVKNIVCAGRSLNLQGRCKSLYRDDVGFSMYLKIPSDFLKIGAEFDVTFVYKNIYGTQYRKIVSFTLNEEATTATKWKMNRARRIN